MYALSLLALIGASQGLVLALVLFTQPYGFRIANQILSIFIGIHAIRLAVYHLIYANQIQYYPIFILVLNLNIALGPLLYCYVKALTEPEYTWHKWDIIHFLPTFVLLIYSFTISLSSEDLTLAYRWWQGDHSMEYRMIGEIIFVSSAVYFLSYIVAAARRLSKHKALIEEYFSNIDGKQLKWLWFVIALCILIPLTTFVEQAIRHYSGFPLGERQVHVTILTVLLVYFMAFMGMRQNFIFAPRHTTRMSLTVPDDAEIESSKKLGLDVKSLDENNDNERNDQNESLSSQAKYEKSGLKEDDIKSLWVRLETLMVQEKPYLDAELKLAELAGMMGLSANYLSQVINRGGSQKFFDYINLYRVKEAVELLQQDSRSSLLNIALDAGFISQQAFSARFKKIEGQTPSQYRKHLQSTV